MRVSHMWAERGELVVELVIPFAWFRACIKAGQLDPDYLDQQKCRPKKE